MYNQTLNEANRWTLDMLDEIILLQRQVKFWKNIFVINNSQHNVLGLSATKVLNLITGINAITLNILNG